MASKLRQVRDAIASALAGINGSGSYSYDLSPTGRVILGPQIFPDVSLPCVNVTTNPFRTTPGRQLGWYTLESVTYLVGRVGADSDSSADREGNALDLANDLTLAVMADRTLGGVVHDVQVSGGAADGATLDLYELGVCSLTVTATVEVSTGV